MQALTIVKPYTVVTRDAHTGEVNHYGAETLRDAQDAMAGFKASGLNAYISNTLGLNATAYRAGF